MFSSPTFEQETTRRSTFRHLFLLFVTFSYYSKQFRLFFLHLNLNSLFHHQQDSQHTYYSVHRTINYMMNVINIRAKYHNEQTGKAILLPKMLTRNRLLTIYLSF